MIELFTADTPNGKKYISRRFIPAKLQDNPYLMQTDDYYIMLASLPEAQRKQFLDGDWDAYTIADIATFPWIARHEWHDIGLKKFEGLTRWYQEISKREAVIKGYDLLKNGEKIPSV